MSINNLGKEAKNYKQENFSYTQKSVFLFISILVAVPVFLVAFIQSYFSEKLGVCFLLMILIMNILGIRYGIKSIKLKEDAIWLTYIGLISHLFFLLITISTVIITLV